MTKAVLMIIMSGLSFLGFVQENQQKPDSVTVKVNINDIGSDKGNVYYMIFNSEADFNNRIPLNSSYSVIENGKTTVTFQGLKTGTYAILCFHDSNENKEIDFSENGIPLERYGLTNNHYNYGPPSFNDAKFDINNANLTFEIELI